MDSEQDSREDTAADSLWSGIRLDAERDRQLQAEITDYLNGTAQTDKDKDTHNSLAQITRGDVVGRDRVIQRVSKVTPSDAAKYLADLHKSEAGDRATPERKHHHPSSSKMELDEGEDPADVQRMQTEEDGAPVLMDQRNPFRAELKTLREGLEEDEERALHRRSSVSREDIVYPFHLYCPFDPSEEDRSRAIRETSGGGGGFYAAGTAARGGLQTTKDPILNSSRSELAVREAAMLARRRETMGHLASQTMYIRDDPVTGAASGSTSKSMSQGKRRFQDVCYWAFKGIPESNTDQFGRQIELDLIQKMFIQSFIQSCVPLIFGNDWNNCMNDFLHEFKLDVINPYTITISPRRMGKSWSIAIFILALLWCVPGIQIGIFSTGGRASESLLGHVARFLHGLPDGMKRLGKKTQNILSVLPEECVNQRLTPFDRQNHRFASVVTAYPDSGDGKVLVFASRWLSGWLANRGRSE